MVEERFWWDVLQLVLPMLSHEFCCANFARERCGESFRGAAERRNGRRTPFRIKSASTMPDGIVDVYEVNAMINMFSSVQFSSPPRKERGFCRTFFTTVYLTLGYSFGV